MTVAAQLMTVMRVVEYTTDVVMLVELLYMETSDVGTEAGDVVLAGDTLATPDEVELEPVVPEQTPVAVTSMQGFLKRNAFCTYC